MELFLNFNCYKTEMLSLQGALISPGLFVYSYVIMVNIWPHIANKERPGDFNTNLTQPLKKKKCL